MAGTYELTQDAGSATKANLKAASGRVGSIRVTNANAAVRYFQIHNKATAPAGTDVPLMWVLLPAGTAAAPSVTTLDANFFGDGGIRCGTGLGWAISTTAASFTDSATAGDHNTTILWS